MDGRAITERYRCPSQWNPSHPQRSRRNVVPKRTDQGEWQILL